MTQQNIETLLHRRPDLSTFLVHFTRDKNGKTAHQNLVSILTDSRLKAGAKLGKAKDEDVEGQEVVCFTETPLEHSWALVEDIQGRQANLEPYGVVFTKIWAREREVNPVWYIDATVGHDWLTKDVDALIEHAMENDKGTEIFRLTPFFEIMGTWRDNQKEFWWEREWRKVGDLSFSWHDLVAVLAPEDEHKQLRTALESEAKKQGVVSEVSVLNFLDPRWGLERMIGSLAGIQNRYIGPFPWRPV